MKGLAEWRATFTDYSITDSNISQVGIMTKIPDFSEESAATMRTMKRADLGQAQTRVTGYGTAQKDEGRRCQGLFGSLQKRNEHWYTLAILPVSVSKERN